MLVFLIEVLILVPTILVMTFVNAGVIMGTLYLLDQKMGPSPEAGSFDFSTSDKKLRQEFILRSVIHGVIGAAAALIVGFALYRIWPTLRAHDFRVALMLVPVMYAAAFFAAGPIHKIERTRALILASVPTVIYLVVHAAFVGNLIH
jgi:hypothetical protein